MAANNPLTSIRELVATAILGYPPIMSLLGDTSRVQIWDQRLDARGDLADHEAMGQRMQLDLAASDTDFDWTSSSVQLTRRFAVRILTADLDAEIGEQLEWLIITALHYLHMRRQPGTADPIEEPEDVRILDIKPTTSDPEREPRDESEEWVTVTDVVVVAEVDRETLLASSAP